MKKYNVELEKGGWAYGKNYTLTVERVDCENNKSSEFVRLNEKDLKGLRDCIDEVLGEEWSSCDCLAIHKGECQPLKEGQEIDEGVFVRKFKDGGWEVHGFNEDSAKEVISALKMLIPSQPIKEEEGECCGEWTGKDSYDCDKDGARTKQGTCKCKCHQEKETPGEWTTAFDPSCLKCVEKESLHFEHTRQEKETENYMIGDEDELLEPEYEKETGNEKECPEKIIDNMLRENIQETRETPKKLPSEMCYCRHPKDSHKGKDNQGYSYKYDCYHCSCTKFILDETVKL